MESSKLDQYLKEKLQKKHYEQSLYAVQLMSNVAKIYGLNPRHAIISSLLHLVSRQMKPEQLLAYIAKHDAKLVERVPENHPVVYYLTGPASAWFTLEELDERSDEVYIGIRDHTFLFRNPSLLAQCLHVASIIAASDQNDPRTVVLVCDFMSGRLEVALNALKKRDVQTLRKTDTPPMIRITNPDFRKPSP
jgi:HD superfamily phosphohydrolase YqeK